ncbi:MAG: YkgJ family cysteine cluster protein [Trichodesmium sp. St16_bin4-tuft]|uniref:YkgJ family cysteine cluster protein n=1 Tax=Trichodesmium erythraeum (strain IMS101) TaxID=203124 RepID=Q112P7_TRIEI|nr:YkgJ family cysteine cluster protein [Trichodesmium erythraeum GBRTRLIN201]MCH2047815.1 YkgJ family cysteine cluster protein [Trichodesmium sp. ALOHA_ZT_67]MDE5068559.1 YkgJ family cysteine cluster protein [Trichodesmium sp. St4_bin8_1]MDE5071583.1 YkgJ family cysteine cluster protein [Trichodesmium sp. St5_bin8]MDE5077385.1 YkgJ family cysteine cluster protein [Trichodesmium sp. St2_bin6]MDE5093987.1 YkgJ family cysteine cluster protein [Trichodesmium sp. St11_bin5]MDE5097838.1 YkgJ famil
MVTWRCIKSCGACCYLDPTERPDLEEYLSAEEVEYYMSLIGADGWCINYDSLSRECRIYPDRPKFCRVQADIFKDMYDVEPEELDEFAIDCCQQHIGDMYGEYSLEMLRFNNAVGVRSGFER